MTPSDAATRAEIVARLAVTREELRRILEPPPKTLDANGHVQTDHDGSFPRSRTMQMLMSGKGLGTLGAVATGLLVSRPALALKLLRFLPVSTVARNLLMRGIAAYRDKRE